MRAAQTIWTCADWLEDRLGERGILALFIVPAVAIIIVGSILFWVCLELCSLFGYGAWRAFRTAWIGAGELDLYTSQYP